jgi:hypothetical protein
MKLLIIAVLFLVSVFFATETRALSCVPSPGPEAEFDQALAIFTGEASSVFNDDNFSYGTKNYAKFRVDQVYKGELPKELTIETDGAWGMRFETGKKYLVYLDKLGPYQIDLCRFGTVSLEDPQAWERIQGFESKGVEPHDPQVQDPEAGGYFSDRPYQQVVFFEWIGAALLLVAGYFLIKKYY